MSAYLLLPIALLRFWFIEAPLGMIRFYASFNASLFRMLSLPLMVSTFFKPLKNEYREGLVGFSIGMGIVVKTVLIFADLLIFLFVLLFELLSTIVFILIPFLSFFIFFGGKI